ncbi:MAG TPA: VWA domain-containing protein [Vicinamibacteria bacterium]|nr:VWA domain-containing protein [Vicinamibacteria bacterium]
MGPRLAGWPAALLLAAAAPSQDRRDVPTFSSQVDLVTVDAVVRDGRGELVRGLTADDFLLLEDGRPQPIASFEAFDAPAPAARPAPPATAGPVATNRRGAEDRGRPFVLLVDDMSLAPARQEDVRRAIVRFLSDGLRDGDDVIFATTSADAWWSARMSEGREDLEALAGRVRGRNLADTGADAISEWEAFRIVHLEGIEAGRGGAPGGAPAATFAPGSNMMERVRQRYLQRGVCDPLQFPDACYAMVRSRAQQVDARRRNRTRDTLAAVDRAVFALTGLRGRKSLLLLTEGFLNDSDLGLVQEVASRCREANVAVYSLDVRGLMAGLGGMSAADAGTPNAAELALMATEQVEFQAAGSVGLAEDTGGFALRNSNDLAGGAVRAAHESRVYYLLGYTPPAGKGPRDWRRLEVKVKRAGLTVRARKGYALRNAAEIAAADAARLAAARGSAAPLPVDVARAAGNAGHPDAIPLRAMAYVLDERPGGTVRTVIALEADTRRLANLGGDARARAVVTLAIVATHRDSGKTVHVTERVEVEGGAERDWEGWLVLGRELELPPGVNQARVVVRDEFLDRLGALTLRFVVPPPATFRMSTPLLTNRLSGAKRGAPAGPVPGARREFPPRGPLYCQFQVFGASGLGGRPAAVAASVELRRRDGTLVRGTTSSAIAPAEDGRLVRLVAFPLDGMAAGDYDMVVRIEETATGRTGESVEPFRITARAR